MTKTETTSSTSSTSTPKADPIGAGIPFPAFDPAAAWAATQQAFHKMLAEAQARTQAFADEYAQIEAQMYARAKLAIDAWAKLAHDAVDYSSQLSAQARKLGADAARKMGA